MDDVIEFFREHGKGIVACGIGSFGPIDARESSPTYGHITSTTKVLWRDFDIVGFVKRALGVPVAFDTDVNAAALGEAVSGAARGIRNVVYVTVGTGVGGGAIVEGAVLHGLLHPEMGHIRVPHDWARDPFRGNCPYHGDCLEGLAAGRAIEARWGVSASAIARDHQAWVLEAEYLGLACANWICTLSPQKIIFGGGVMQSQMFPLVRERTRSLLNDYVDVPEITENIDSYIVPPLLGHRSGMLGALELAQRCVSLANSRS